VVDIVDNEAEHRYEAYLDGDLAGFIVYLDEARGRVFLHTEVDPAFEGKGVGGQLVKGALESVRARGAKMVPVCPFVTAYLKRHPEYADIVTS
jgi:predicted GNAT family acetyltransferase